MAKKVIFKPPFRVGRKSGTTVLDSNGIEVVNFRDEEKAKEYVEFLNNKHRDDLWRKAGEALQYEADLVITIHRPKEKFLVKFKRMMTNLVPRKKSKR